MQITCPSCQFTREVADDQIPARSKVATCPECGLRFQFRELDETVPLSQKEAAEQSQSPKEITSSSTEDTTAPEPPPYYGPDGRGLDQPYIEPEPLPDHPPEEPHSPGLSAAERYLASKQAKSEAPGSMESPQADLPSGPVQVEVPFEDLENFGFFSGMFHTIKRACFSPRLFFSVMPLRGLVRPFVFGLLVTEFMFIMTAFWQLSGVPDFSSLMMEMRGVTPLTPEEALNPMLLFIAIPFGYLFNLLLSTIIVHGVLSIIGGGKRGFEGTLRVLAYAYAPMILGAIPFGIIPAVFWSLAISVIGLKHMHSTDFARSILAHLAVFLVLSLLYFLPMVPAAPAG